jgi:glutathione synthase/RimK-type ligase-like ATP-grasp enzyme
LNRARAKTAITSLVLHGAFGQKTLNSSSVEFVCYSKLRTLLNLWKEGLPIPKTVFVPCDSSDMMKNGREIRNEKDIADLLEAEISLNEGIVVKADAGTHGKMIMLSKNREELLASITKLNHYH